MSQSPEVCPTSVVVRDHFAITSPNLLDAIVHQHDMLREAAVVPADHRLRQKTEHGSKDVVLRPVSARVRRTGRTISGDIRRNVVSSCSKTRARDLIVFNHHLLPLIHGQRVSPIPDPVPA